jgi:hypothetical protein
MTIQNKELNSIISCILIHMPSISSNFKLGEILLHYYRAKQTSVNFACLQKTTVDCPVNFTYVRKIIFSLLF